MVSDVLNRELLLARGGPPGRGSAADRNSTLVAEALSADFAPFKRDKTDNPMWRDGVFCDTTAETQIVDFDEAAEALSSKLLPIRLTPEREGPQRLGLNVARLGQITVAYVRMDKAVHIECDVPDYYCVSIPLQGRVAADIEQSSSGRLSVEPGAASICNPRQHISAVWDDNSTSVALLLPRPAVDSRLETLLGRTVVKPVLFESRMELTSGAGNAWMEIVWLLGRLLSPPADLVSLGPFATHLQELLVDGLLLGQRHSYSEMLYAPERSTAPRAVRKAIELIESHPARNWSVADLAKEASVSVRVLQLGFKSSIGVPPSRYLLEVRLNRVHSTLVEGYPPDTTVWQTAARWGFTDPGRFASAYQRRFGELPSETLRKVSPTCARALNNETSPTC